MATSYKYFKKSVQKQVAKSQTLGGYVRPEIAKQGGVYSSGTGQYAVVDSSGKPIPASGTYRSRSESGTSTQSGQITESQSNLSNVTEEAKAPEKEKPKVRIADRLKYGSELLARSQGLIPGMGLSKFEKVSTTQAPQIVTRTTVIQPNEYSKYAGYLRQREKIFGISKEEKEWLTRYTLTPKDSFILPPSATVPGLMENRDVKRVFAPEIPIKDAGEKKSFTKIGAGIPSGEKQFTFESYAKQGAYSDYLDEKLTEFNKSVDSSAINRLLPGIGQGSKFASGFAVGVTSALEVPARLVGSVSFPEMFKVKGGLEKTPERIIKGVGSSGYALVTGVGGSIYELASNPVGVMKRNVKSFSASPYKYTGKVTGELTGFSLVSQAPKLIVQKIGAIGVKKVNLEDIKTSKETFPQLKGGVKQLEKEYRSGKTQEVLKKEFSFLEKDKPIGVRTTTVKTKPGVEVPSLSYEERGLFTSSNVSEIGLPQLKGSGYKPQLKFTLFGSGSDKGIIEVFKGKGFRLLPTTKKGVTISKTEYLNLSKQVGIDLTKLGSAKQGLSRIRVKPGQNIFEREYSKVSIGKRPFKLREIDTLTGGRKFTEKAFVEPTVEPGIFYPSRAFQLGATTESEAILFPPTKVKTIGYGTLREKIGFPTSYAKSEAGLIDIRFYEPVSSSELSKMGLIDKLSIELQSKRFFDYQRTVSRARQGIYEIRVPTVPVSRAFRINEPSYDLSRPISSSYESRYSIPSPRIVTTSRKITTIQEVSPIIRESSISRDFGGYNESRIVTPEIREPIREITPPIQPPRIIPRKITPPIQPPRIPTRIITPPIIPPKIPPYVPERTVFIPTRKIRDLNKIGFGVFSRVKGKTVKLGSNLPKNLAIAVGKSFTGQTTARSFVIKQEGITRLPDIAPQELFKYREPKPFGKVAREGFKFVEKSKFAIDTIGEIKGLRAGKKLKIKKPRLLKKFKTIGI